MVQAFLLDPLEVRGGFFLSEPIAPGTMAEGHVRRPDGQIAALAAIDRAGREWAPAGGLALSATGLLRLARLHLDDGRTPLGFPLLDAGLVAEMRSPAVTVPDPTFADAWGLGWALFGGGDWFGHDGEDEGWTTRVRASVDGRFAIAMVANCLPAQREWNRLIEALAAVGIAVGDPVLPEPAEPAPPIDAGIVGSYENGNGRLAIVERDDCFWLTNDHERLPLRPLDEDRCLAQPMARGEQPFLVAFVRDDDGRVRYLHVNGRLARRAA
jgi:CubicO group peptidase (beta-lactamase class C family)